MRANYKVPKNTQKKIVIELYQYWENLNQLEKIPKISEEDLDIIESTPLRDETGIKSKNQISKPTEQKAIKLADLSTRGLIEATKRVRYVSEALKRLNQDELEVVQYIFKDKMSQKQVETQYYISYDTYYNTKNKIIYFTALEYGEIY